jgi:outer membrane protein
MFRVLSISIFLSISLCAGAQTYTLQQCIDSALANNIPVKQSALLAQSASVDMNQARMNVLPNAMLEIYHGLNNGRSIDPTSNAFVNQTFNSASYRFNTDVTLFNGGSLQNRIRQQVAAYDASRMEWQQAKDNLVLNVILAYLQVLNNEDILTSAMNQASVSQKQLERLDVLNKQGAIKPSEFTDVKGQLMNDELSIVTARNTLETSKLTLAQLMNKPYSRDMKLERLDVTECLSNYNNSSDGVYQNALQQFAQIKAVELRSKSYNYGYRSARGALFPTFYLSGGMDSRYSSLGQNAAGTGKSPYNTQLKDNLFSALGVGVQIPLFNRMLQRNRAKQAEILYKNSQLEEDRTKILVRQNIDQAYLNMTNAYDRYKVLLEQVDAYNESFKAAEARYNSGVGTSIDYLTAKDRLDRANINLISAKYDFVLRKKILDYYSNSNAANRQ